MKIDFIYKYLKNKFMKTLEDDKDENSSRERVEKLLESKNIEIYFMLIILKE